MLLDKESVLLFYFLLQKVDLAEGGVGCRDQNGSPVDWYIKVKLPQVRKAQNPLISEGFGFLYMDVNNPQWVMSNTSIAKSTQATGYTLQQIYQAKDVAYVLYNDEHPHQKESYTSYGHTKGVVAFDEKGGFWLVHSVPHFPGMTKNKYEYPNTGREYGQSFLCMSLGYKFLDTLGTLFWYNNPSIYDKNFPSSFMEDNPNMAKVLNGGHVTESPWNKYSELVSKGGQQFTAFAKFDNFNADIYTKWIAPYFQSSLYTETWQHGHGRLQSACGKQYMVENIKTLRFPAADLSYKESQDHSKWAVAKDIPITCIGDINRMESQEHRAGGTVCFKMPTVYKNFKNAVKEVEKCYRGT